jgi:hypothetical protein
MMMHCAAFLLLVVSGSVFGREEAQVQVASDAPSSKFP